MVIMGLDFQALLLDSWTFCIEQNKYGFIPVRMCWVVAVILCLISGLHPMQGTPSAVDRGPDRASSAGSSSSLHCTQCDTQLGSNAAL